MPQSNLSRSSLVSLSLGLVLASAMSAGCAMEADPQHEPAASSPVVPPLENAGAVTTQSACQSNPYIEQYGVAPSICRSSLHSSERCRARYGDNAWSNFSLYVTETGECFTSCLVQQCKPGCPC